MSPSDPHLPPTHHSASYRGRDHCPDTLLLPEGTMHPINIATGGSIARSSPKSIFRHDNKGQKRQARNGHTRALCWQLHPSISRVHMCANVNKIRGTQEPLSFTKEEEEGPARENHRLREVTKGGPTLRLHSHIQDKKLLHSQPAWGSHWPMGL